MSTVMCETVQSLVTTMPLDSAAQIAIKKGFMRRVTKLYISQIVTPPESVQQFKNLRQHFDDPLARYLRRKGLNADSYGIDLLMLSRDEDHLDLATPWIVISCECSITKTVRKFFNRSPIKEACQSHFDLLILDEPVVEYAGTHHDVSIVDDLRLDSTKIHLNAGDHVHYATLGGILKLTWSDGTFAFVGVTAGHMFRDRMADQNAAKSSDGTVPFHGSESSSSSLEPLKSMFDFETDSDSGSDDESEGDATEYIIHRDPSEILKPEKAIQGIHPEHITLIGSIRTSDYIRNAHHLSDSDWSLVTFKDSKACLSLTSVLQKSISTKVKEAVEWEGLGSRVVIATGDRGFLEGYLGWSTSFIRIAGGSRLIETYSLILRSGIALSPGDCGSWVINAANGIIYGHVIAGNSVPTAYVLPMEAIMNDISATNDAKRVKVADLRELSSLLQLPVLDHPLFGSVGMYGQKKEFKSQDSTWFSPGRIFTVRDNSSWEVRFAQYVVLDKDENGISCFVLNSCPADETIQQPSNVQEKSVPLKEYSPPLFPHDTIYLEESSVRKIRVDHAKIITSHAHHMQIEDLQVRHEAFLWSGMSLQEFRAVNNPKDQADEELSARYMSERGALHSPESHRHFVTSYRANTGKLVRSVPDSADKTQNSNIPQSRGTPEDDDEPHPTPVSPNIELGYTGNENAKDYEDSVVHHEPVLKEAFAETDHVDLKITKRKAGGLLGSETWYSPGITLQGQRGIRMLVPEKLDESPVPSIKAARTKSRPIWRDRKALRAFLSDFDK